MPGVPASATAAVLTVTVVNRSGYNFVDRLPGRCGRSRGVEPQHRGPRRGRRQPRDGPVGRRRCRRPRCVRPVRRRRRPRRRLRAGADRARPGWAVRRPPERRSCHRHPFDGGAAARRVGGGRRHQRRSGRRLLGGHQLDDDRNALVGLLHVLPTRRRRAVRDVEPQRQRSRPDPCRGGGREGDDGRRRPRVQGVVVRRRPRDRRRRRLLHRCRQRRRRPSGLFVPMPPQRILDTRKPGAIGRLWPRWMVETAIPDPARTDAQAIVANVTAVDAGAPGGSPCSPPALRCRWCRTSTSSPSTTTCRTT